jgi:hypothetical protein
LGNNKNSHATKEDFKIKKKGFAFVQSGFFFSIFTYLSIFKNQAISLFP